ncbi:MAG: hypothetical protein P4L40_21270, partial [Terracidiphilus sp.]|nr:hypothetical protein [Terracidiphilus sp.]
DRLRLLFELMSDVGQMGLLAQLRCEVALWGELNQDRHKRHLWWDATYNALWRLRRCVSEVDVQVIDAVLQAVSTQGDCRQAAAQLGRSYKCWVLKQEEVVRREALAARTSLQEVWELLDTPNMHPFAWTERSQANVLRTRLRGGRLAWFGHAAYHLPRCPACGQQEDFRVYHLVRDCPAFDLARSSSWRKAHTVAQAAGVMGPDASPVHADQRHNWYLLTVGAAVPHSFLGLKTDAPTHFARVQLHGETAAQRHLGRHVAEYAHILHEAGHLLVVIDMVVKQQLRAWGMQPQRGVDDSGSDEE